MVAIATGLQCKVGSSTCNVDITKIIPKEYFLRSINIIPAPVYCKSNQLEMPFL